MGFLDKATAAAKQAAADAKKAATDFQAANPNLMSGNLGGGPSGGAQADRLLRDLGALTYLNAQGRPGSAEEYQRIMGELQGLESAGGLNLTLISAYAAPGAPPPPPGAVRSAYEASQCAAATSAADGQHSATATRLGTSGPGAADVRRGPRRRSGNGRAPASAQLELN